MTINQNTTQMDEASIVANFDSVVKSGLAFYDDEQVMIEHVDEGLNVGT